MEELFQSGSIINSRYSLINEIDSYNIYTSYLCRSLIDERLYTIKIFHSYNYPNKKEIKINEKIAQYHNPRFIKMIDSSSWLFIRNDNMEYIKYMVFEYCQFKDLLTYLNYEGNGLSERVCGVIFLKVLKAVQYLHNIGISIGNLKLENIFIDLDTLNIKIQDFSQSSFIKNSKGEKILLKKLVRTTHNDSPEKFKEILYDGEKDDILRLGHLLFTLKTGKEYFSLNKNLLKLIKSKKIDFWKFIGIKDLSPEFKEFYISMMAYEPHERPTIEELFNKDWIQKIINLNENEKNIYEHKVRSELKKSMNNGK